VLSIDNVAAALQVAAGGALANISILFSSTIGPLFAALASACDDSKAFLFFRDEFQFHYLFPARVSVSLSTGCVVLQ